jgi:long-subunit acyl-CoA synthetase (AMP-forming)
VNSLLAQLEQRAQCEPRDILLHGGGISLSAAELLAEIQEVSLALRAADAGTVALYADNSPYWAVVDLACQFAGICLVPVPTFFSSEQIRHLLHSAGVDVLVYQESLAGGLVGIPRENVQPLPEITGYCAAGLAVDSAALAPAHTSKITFTSGSTGEPKGVCLSFQQCLTVAQSLAQAIGVDKPLHLCVLPLSTLLENIGGLYTPLLTGGSSVVLPAAELGMQGSSGIDAAVFLDALTRYQPNTLILVPQLLAVLDAALEQGWRAPASLRFVAVGGARVAAALVQRVRAAGLPVYEGYGLSECASVVSLNAPGCDRAGTSGRVLPHVEVVARDGELIVSGNSFLGYLNQPETWDSPTVSTGDTGSVDGDGFVTVKGRSKNTLISSFGRNISPEWVESELLAGGLFRQVVVVGDGRPCCAALLLPVDAAATDAQIQAEIDAVNKRLPDYARLGHWVRLPTPLSSADGLLTDNGRPRRERIFDRYAPAIDQLYCESQESLAS